MKRIIIYAIILIIVLLLIIGYNYNCENKYYYALINQSCNVNGLKVVVNHICGDNNNLFATITVHFPSNVSMDGLFGLVEPNIARWDIWKVLGDSIYSFNCIDIDSDNRTKTYLLIYKSPENIYGKRMRLRITNYITMLPHNVFDGVWQFDFLICGESNIITLDIMPNENNISIKETCITPYMIIVMIDSLESNKDVQSISIDLTNGTSIVLDLYYGLRNEDDSITLFGLFNQAIDIDAVKGVTLD